MVILSLLLSLLLGINMATDYKTDMEFQRDIGFILDNLETFKTKSGKRITYQNLPGDPGNWRLINGKRVNGGTNWGISFRYNPEIKTAEQMRNLTRDEAKKIYYEKYWLPLKNRGLPQRLKALAFDMNITVGPGATKRYLDTMSETRDLTDQSKESENFKILTQLRWVRATKAKHNRRIGKEVKARVPKSVKIIYDNIPKNIFDGVDLKHSK